MFSSLSTMLFSPPTPTLFPADPTVEEMYYRVGLLTPTTEESLLVTSLKRIAELLVFGEKQLKYPVLETYFEMDGPKKTYELCRDTDSTHVRIQILQTCAILSQSLKENTHLYQFLSQNHVNRIVGLFNKKDLGLTQDDELTAQYVSFLKTLALRLDRNLCQFFFDAEAFPLYDKAMELFEHEEPMVRAAARSILLMVQRVDDQQVKAYVKSREDYFWKIVNYVRSRRRATCELIELPLAGKQTYDVSWLQRLEAILSDELDDVVFLQDVLSLLDNPEREEDILIEALINPMLSDANSISENEQGDVQTNHVVSLWGLAQICSSMRRPRLLHRIFEGLFFANSNEMAPAGFRLFFHHDERIALAAGCAAYFLVDNPSALSVTSEDMGVHSTPFYSVPVTPESGFRSRRSIGSSSAKLQPPPTPEYQKTQAISSDDEVDKNLSLPPSTPTRDAPKFQTLLREVTHENHQDNDDEVETLLRKDYPVRLVDTCLRALVQRTTATALPPRPVTIRLFCKLLVHVTFDVRHLDDENSLSFLTPEHSLLLKRAISNAALRLHGIASKPTTDSLTFIESIEDEWKELKSGPLRVLGLINDASCVIPGPDELKFVSYLGAVGVIPMEQEAVLEVDSSSSAGNAEEAIRQKLKTFLHDRVPLASRAPLHRLETVRSSANCFMVLRLAWASLEKTPDVMLPSIGNADVGDIGDDAAIDLRKCEFLEVSLVTSSNNVLSTPTKTMTMASASSNRVGATASTILSKKYLLVLIAGAMIIVEPDDSRKLTGICRCVAPIHRIEVGSDVTNSSVLHVCVRSLRKIGLGVSVKATPARSNFKQQEWCLSLKFDSEARAMFARDQIELATKRFRDEKFTRTKALLAETICKDDEVAPVKREPLLSGVGSVACEPILISATLETNEVVDKSFEEPIECGDEESPKEIKNVDDDSAEGRNSERDDSVEGRASKHDDTAEGQIREHADTPKGRESENDTADGPESENDDIAEDRASERDDTDGDPNSTEPPEHTAQRVAGGEVAHKTTQLDKQIE